MIKISVDKKITIGEKLKELRKAAKKTVAKVAEHSGIKPQRVSFYEMDKGIPTIPILLKLAQGLDCSIFDIIDEPLGREEEMCIHTEICPFYQKKIEENAENKKNNDN